MKRIFDLFVVIFLLVILSPVIIVVAVLARFFLGTPVIFRQQRPGLHGRPFYLYKFRTMTDERDNDGSLLADEKRLTPFGLLLRQSSLDELPQLFNVLRGDISLVGPRPLLMEYLPLYSQRQSRRHEVRPGITGWAQVNGRNSIAWQERLELDVWYVENRSMFLDLKIMFMTVIKVFSRSGINQPGHVTMSKFTGNEISQ